MNKVFKDFFSVRMITLNAIVATLYCVLTIALPFLSYSYMQVRISEFLNLLVFFNPSYTLGLTIGCLLANLFSTNGIIDVILGTFATLISSLIMILISKLIKKLFISSLVPSFINAIIVPFIIYLSCINTEIMFSLTLETYFIMFGWTFLGEFISISIFGYILFLSFKRYYPNFYKLINATNNIDFKW